MIVQPTTRDVMRFAPPFAGAPTLSVPWAHGAPASDPTPADVSGVVLWYDPDDPTTYTTYGSSPVRVQQAASKGPNTGVIVRGTGPNAGPQPVAAAKNGRTAWLFDMNSFLENEIVVQAQPFTVFVVFCGLWFPNSGHFMVCGAAHQGNGIFQGQYNSGYMHTQGTTNCAFDFKASDNVWYLAEAVFDDASSELLINGVSKTKLTSSPGSSSTTWLAIGGDQDGQQTWNGYIGDVVCMSGRGPTNRGLVRSYLMTKWGLT